MPDDITFTELIRRVRAGDHLAAAELVRRYEPEIRTQVRLWLLRRPRQLRSVLDSMDICQSVLASFFVRTAAGQYELDQPEQLIGLLVGMARNKLSEQVKHHLAQRRDVRRGEQLGPHQGAKADNAASPSAVLTGRDLLEAVWARLSPEERQLADLKAKGLAWAEVAEQTGGTPEGRRKQLGRAVDRILKELAVAE
jgi:ECF sigma factor